MPNFLTLVKESRWLEYLREVYTPQPVPPCPVCGATLTIASVGGGLPTKWACPEAHPLRTGDWDHYRASQYTERNSGDSKVVALLDWIDSDPERKAQATAVLLEWERGSDG